MKRQIDNHFIITIIMGLLSILAVFFFPSKTDGDDGIAVPLFFSLLLIIYIMLISFHKNHQQKMRATSDIAMILFLLLVTWEFLTRKLGVLSNFLYPSIQDVITQFIGDGPEFLLHLMASIKLLGSGLIFTIITAIPLGILTASNKRLEFIMRPTANVVSPIPPIVWIPYAVAILPSFKASSTFIIFIGAFWPIFVNTLNGVANIDQRYIKSAQTLGLNRFDMISKIIIPAALPSIFSGITVGLILSFILLTAAEMIGSSAGIGYYIKMATDYGNYTKVISGIIFIGIVVTIIMTLFNKLERHFLRWRG